MYVNAFIEELSNTKYLIWYCTSSLPCNNHLFYAHIFCKPKGTFSVQSANIANMGNGIACGWCYFAEGSQPINGCTFHLPSYSADLSSSTHRNFSIKRKDADQLKAMGCYNNDCNGCITNCSAFVYGGAPSNGEGKPAVIITNINLSCYSAPASTEQNCCEPC